MHQDTPSPRDLIELRAAAERIGVSVYTMRRYVREGILRSYRVGPTNGNQRVDPADVDALVWRRETPRSAGTAISYRDPTGETAARNVDRKRRGTRGSA